ncbi:MAG: TetR/AcrR family transcriptional regulator [Clostridiaceae bacterium]|nr:TetR/AcrR family transcriptional regulator [Clostridiaceae bacterium]
MPKTFSEGERTYIKKRLMEEAQVCLTQFGMRKTTVDELVKRVNIPKGTFYLFYPSKEMLFFDVFCALHDELQADVLRQVDELHGNINADTITELIFRLYKQVDSTFIYSFAASGDLELLVRKLPSEIAEAHARKDDFSMEKLLSMLPGVHVEGNTKIFSAALRAVFCTMAHKREIGEDVFDDTIRVMLRGVVTQLFEGERL